MLSIQFTRKRILVMLYLLVVQLLITSNKHAYHIYTRLQSVHRIFSASLADFFSGHFIEWPAPLDPRKRRSSFQDCFLLLYPLSYGVYTPMGFEPTTHKLWWLQEHYHNSIQAATAAALWGYTETLTRFVHNGCNILSLMLPSVFGGQDRNRTCTGGASNHCSTIGATCP